MISLMILTDRDIEQLIKKEGSFLSRQKGSHRQYKHASKKGLVTIPFHGNRDIPKGTVFSILKQAGLR
jgi:predicted RNA binding protein YcfA (HicA-like mRNA interferase family)